MVDALGGLQYDFTPKVTRQLPVPPEAIEAVQQGMWSVVNSAYGTGTAAQVEGVEVAGKTGTAEFCEIVEVQPGEQDCRRDDEDNLPTHAWFTAYAPFENPEIVLVVFIYDGGEGSANALPVAKTILDAYFHEIHPRSSTD
jgi:penicillin-binding protein 2